MKNSIGQNSQDWRIFIMGEILSEEDWEETLDCLKEEKLPEERLLLVNEEHLRLAAAWVYIEKTFDETLKHTCFGKEDIWDCVKFDIDGLALDIVYPDGELPEDVSRMIKHITSKKMLPQATVKKKDEKQHA
jgi:hypothetical protein